MKSYLFKSERLGFRRWTQEDVAPFAAMNADEEVMAFFPRIQTLTETQELVDRLRGVFDQYGYCFYAVDQLDTEEFIGFIGFIYQKFEASFTPCVEIGWRLRRASWGQGLATEGARRCLEYGYEVLQFDEVYSITPIPNVKSERIMQKIGMFKVGEFNHPKLEKGHWLETHALYKSERMAT